jgi:predicted transposase/invertase (TIGR01784 family)
MDNNLVNPHDKLFRKTWSNIDVAKDYLNNYLPGPLLKLIDLDSLEISKDSFIEKELEDYYSDILYKVGIAGSNGYVYLLFEHKSYPDRLIHLQLLGYMLKIWQLHLTQAKKQPLPIIIPIVFYHGRKKWSGGQRLSVLFSNNDSELQAYIPDFEFVLHDLTQLSDDQIKGNVLFRTVALLFKHIFDPDITDRLPGILSLLKELSQKETGIEYIESLLRYLLSTVEEISTEGMKTILEQSLPNINGDLVMTLAEKWKKEGFEQGIQQGVQQGIQQGVQQGVQQGIRQGMQQGMQQGVRQGLLEGIELALILKFGKTAENKKLLKIMKKIQSVDQLKQIKSAILEVKTITELIDRFSR